MRRTGLDSSEKQLRVYTLPIFGTRAAKNEHRVPADVYVKSVCVES
jgi:hypothetical protein